MTEPHPCHRKLLEVLPCRTHPGLSSPKHGPSAEQALRKGLLAGPGAWSGRGLQEGKAGR